MSKSVSKYKFYSFKRPFQRDLLVIYGYQHKVEDDPLFGKKKLYLFSKSYKYNFNLIFLPFKIEFEIEIKDVMKGIFVSKIGYISYLQGSVKFETKYD